MDKLYILDANPFVSASYVKLSAASSVYKDVLRLLTNAYDSAFYKANPHVKGLFPRRANLAHDFNRVFSFRSNREWLINYACYLHVVSLYNYGGSHQENLRRLTLAKYYSPANLKDDTEESKAEFNSLIESHRSQAPSPPARYLLTAEALNLFSQ